MNFSFTYILKFILKLFNDILSFVKNASQDPRIPKRDKIVLMALIALIVSPLDIIPDWIPFLGQVDDAVIIALILDYLFVVLDRDILLKHFPWGEDKFHFLELVARAARKIVPPPIKKYIWQYREIIIVDDPKTDSSKANLKNVKETQPIEDDERNS